MTSRKIIKIFDFNGVNVAKHWHVAGEVSDCIADNRKELSPIGNKRHTYKQQI